VRCDHGRPRLLKVAPANLNKSTGRERELKRIIKYDLLAISSAERSDGRFNFGNLFRQTEDLRESSKMQLAPPTSRKIRF
jgi:hypothetical protein